MCADDAWTEAIVILPEGGERACPAPAVLTIHGTNRHDTPDDLHEFACRWLDRFLRNGG